MEYYFYKLVEWLHGVFHFATPVQIIEGIFYTVLLTINGLGIIWMMKDSKRFNKKLIKGTADFENALHERVNEHMKAQKEIVKKAIDEGQDKVDEAIAESNRRIDVLSRENVKLLEQNEFYRDKLKNMGFSDESLNP